MGLDLEPLLAFPVRHAIAPYQMPPERAGWLFEAGLPDPATFPHDDLARLSALVVGQPAALQYGGARDAEAACGYVGLRDVVAARTRGVRSVDRHHIMLTAGAAQALMLLFEAFVDPGDAVAVEVPTWNAVLAALARRGAELHPITMDDDGARVDDLEATLERLAAAGRRIKLFYTIATFNTPAGVSLSLARRRRLLELASKWNFVVVEDNVYYELRYDGEPLPTLFELDGNGVVAKVDSFSKVIAPGVRIGWITASPETIRALARIRGDLGVSQWMARVMERYVADGLLDPHIVEVRELYRTKRDVAEQALHRHADPWVRWRTPDGGFYLWVELDRHVDAARVMERALEGGVLCRAGERFFGDGDTGRQHFRLAFPSVPVSELERGIAVLGEAISFASRTTTVP